MLDHNIQYNMTNNSDLPYVFGHGLLKHCQQEKLKISSCAGIIQSDLNSSNTDSSNTDGSFIMAHSKSFLSPLEILLIA